MKKLAIFASGNGSNFQAIVNAVRTGKLRADISLLVCDSPNAFAIKRAEDANIPVLVFHPNDYESKTDFESMIAENLEVKKIDFIALAGYMRLIGHTLLSKYEGKIVNIHPSLLPAFPGKDAIGQALSAGVKESGVTIHYVDAGMDTGQVIAQKTITIADNETKETLQRKIQQIEHQLYPDVLEKLLNGTN